MCKIQVDGMVHDFEDHPYCGPTLLNRNGEPLRRQPRRFLEAASQWYQNARRIGKDGLCEWFEPQKNILKHLGGNHYEVVGQSPLVKGY